MAGKSKTGDIRKRTPLEQAIAEQTNRVARYEARMRAKGFRRTTIFVHEQALETVKAFIRKENARASGEPCND